jgi:hypothetical protein
MAAALIFECVYIKLAVKQIVCVFRFKVDPQLRSPDMSVQTGGHHAPRLHSPEDSNKPDGRCVRVYRVAQPAESIIVSHSCAVYPAWVGCRSRQGSAAGCSGDRRNGLLLAAPTRETPQAARPRRRSPMACRGLLLAVQAERRTRYRLPDLTLSARRRSQSPRHGAALALQRLVELGCDVNAVGAHLDITEADGVKHTVLVEEVVDWLKDDERAGRSVR